MDQAAQPNGTPQLGEVHPARRPLLSANQNDTPATLSPFRRQNPREEPGALAAHAGICTGGEEKSSSLPRPSPVASDVGCTISSSLSGRNFSEFPHLLCLSIASSSSSSDRGEMPSIRNPGNLSEAVVSICISST
jgi:hypothetical protein